MIPFLSFLRRVTPFAPLFRRGSGRGRAGRSPVHARQRGSHSVPLRRSPRRGFTLVEMAVVILILAILTGIFISLIDNLAFLKSSRDEAEILRDTLIFSRQAAVKSDQTIYVEFDLDEEEYRSYRMDRSGEKAEEESVVKKRTLSSSNSLVAVATSDGHRIKEGRVTLVISPYGEGEELVFYLGTEMEVKASVVFEKYGGSVRIYPGEIEHNLENPAWREDLEQF